MTKQVQILADVLPLPDGQTYSRGRTVTLTDAQFALIPSYEINVDVIDLANPPTPPPPIVRDGDGGGSGAPSAAGDVITANLPDGFEFAFWGYHPTHVNQITMALRVTSGPKDVSGWSPDYVLTTLEAGFNWDDLSDDANYSAVQTGEYVVLSVDTFPTPDQYADNVAQWGFDPRSFLPGAWQPRIAEAEAGGGGGSAGFSLQAIVTGEIPVASHLVKPGLLVPQAGTVTTLFAEVDEAPVGDDMVIGVERWVAGVNTADLGTLTILDGSKTATVTGLSVAVTALDVIRFRVESVGSTTPGSGLLLAVNGT